MGEVRWLSHRLETAALTLAWYDAGSGEPLIFLSGGPGDSHVYMREVAAPLTGEARCILYDQRGTGRSEIEVNEATMRLAGFLADLEALRARLALERMTLIGHSWGAQLALHYAVAHPERVERLVLIGLGPLDEEARAVASANLLLPLTAAERAHWQALSARRRAVLDTGDLATFHEIHLEQMALRLRAWFYSPERASAFLEQYRAGYDLRPEVNRLVVADCRRRPVWGRLDAIDAPTLVVYGYQDFEPITQAARLREELTSVEVTMLNECGHLPWLEQPERFYAALRSFLSPGAADAP